MHVVKVPCINGLSKTKGCEEAGNAVLEKLNELYTNEQGKPISTKLLDIEEIHVDNSNIDEANELIRKNALKDLKNKPKIFFIGGDHSISYSLGKAFLEHCEREEKEPCLMVFDAHPDLMKPIDKKIPTHEEWLRALIEEGFPAQNILIVGLRNSYPEELNFISKNKIKTISLNRFVEDFRDTCDAIMEFVNGRELYLSIDIDVVDPVFAPGTSYSEPGGLTSREMIYLIQKMNKIKTLKTVDLVEINPSGEGSEMSVKLGAKILGEFL